MKEFIKKIKEKPYEDRKKIAAISSIFIVFVIFSFWVMAIIHQINSGESFLSPIKSAKVENPTPSTTSENSASVFSFGDSIDYGVTIFSNIKEKFSNIISSSTDVTYER